MILSIAAITGGATFLPPIWALFSKRISATAVLSASVLALAISLFFKLAAPPLIGFGLNRAMEMTVGVGVPTLVLLAFELSLKARGVTSPGVGCFESHRLSLPKTEAATVQSRFGAKVVAYSILYIGTCLLMLGWLAPHSRLLVVSIASAVLATGAVATWLTRADSKVRSASGASER
jgi:hypothetical protein